MVNLSIAQSEISFLDGNFEEILERAKDKKKNIFIDTYADWCVPCKRMEKRFRDKEVAKFYNENFINYRVNMQNPHKANQLRRRYDIVFLPTMIIVDPNGIVKYQVDRELSVEELLGMGQKALDPSTYHISEATAIRRNTNNVVNKKTEERYPVGKKLNPKNNTEGQKTVAVNETQGIESEGSSTSRKEFLDGYETVDESSQKVLAVLGAGELPPEILLQEAYLRFEFMDGSHRQAARNYLATQENWDTDVNRKFILDFVYNTASPEYEFIIANRSAFDLQFGEDKVSKSLEILTYRALHNAVPRPDLQQAIQLYTNLGTKEPIRQGYNYYIARLIAEDHLEEVLELNNQYLEIAPLDHEFKYCVANYLTYKDETNDNLLKIANDLMENALSVQPSSLVYLDLTAEIYTKLGKNTLAKRTYQKAINIAKKEGKDCQKYESKVDLLNG